VGSPATRLDTFPDELCEWAPTGRINKTTSTHTHNLQTPTETFTSRETTYIKKTLFFKIPRQNFDFGKNFQNLRCPSGTPQPCGLRNSNPKVFKIWESKQVFQNFRCDFGICLCPDLESPPECSSLRPAIIRNN
jgi:hypothetical protein